MPPKPLAPTYPPVARLELLWLAAALLVGAILRLSYPGRMAIEHFDEGVYASNFWFDSGEYPARHLYAPPLLPTAIEWTMIIASLLGLKPTGMVPMIPSLVAGLATIPSMWWVGRRWFGPTAGLVAAWLVATSDFHASYSRAALTDVPVSLFILWGTYFTWQAIQTGQRRSLILGAVFTALAWWTKYNGWLPLAIGISGAAAQQVFLPRSERQIWVVGQRWLVVAGLAFLFWSPVLIGLQKHGGYAAVAANHRQYVQGFSAWIGNAESQIVNITVYEDHLAGIADWLPFGFRLQSATTWILFLGAVAGCVFAAVGKSRVSAQATHWNLLAWICGLTVATPCYYPYPRLVLPWLVAVWLGAGLLVQIITDSGKFISLNLNPTDRPWTLQWFEVLICACLVASLVVRFFLDDVRAWEDRTNLAERVVEVSRHIKSRAAAQGSPEDEGIVYVYGSPPIVFHLAAAGLPLTSPVQNLDFVSQPHPRPVFLVRTELALDDPGFQTAWEAAEGHFDSVLVGLVKRSYLVFLDSTVATPWAVKIWCGHVRD